MRNNAFRNDPRPPDPSAFVDPLDFIGAEHLRERAICALIDTLAGPAPLDRQAALTVLRFLNEELTMHIRDDTEDLFPLLDKRCVAEDDIAATLNRIVTSQNEAMRLLPRVRIALARCLDNACDLSARESRMLKRFAHNVRGHLVVENAILLPIARVRLTARDLRALSQRMRARRGLPSPQEPNDAC